MSLLKRLREFVKHKDNRIKGTAFLAQLAVFKDIIPGYRIRLTTEKEKEAKVTKEVRKLRQFEEGLLSNYQGFLRELENTVKSIRSKSRPLAEQDSLLLARAVKCFTELLTCASHFNFKLNIMTEVVGLSAMKDPETISQMCYEAMITLFKEDEQGESALEAVKLISKFIQSRHYKGCESILRTFAHLRLANELTRKNTEEKKEKIKKKDREHFSKRQKKQMKVDAEIQKELKEAEAVVDLEERQKIHTETLKHVMVLYFKILKDDHAHHLLPAVLEGLSKFGHLVNVDFFADILKCLRQISQNIQKQYTECQPAAHDPRTALHCIVAAFQLLSGQGEALEIDLKDFVAIIYQLLHRLPCQTNYCVSNSHFETTPFEDALKVIDLAFIQRKQVIQMSLVMRIGVLIL
jgi:nucleolar complex protein 3